MDHLKVIGYIFIGYIVLFLLACLRSLDEPSSFNFIINSLLLCVGLAFGTTMIYSVVVGIWFYGLMLFGFLVLLSSINWLFTYFTGWNMFHSKRRRHSGLNN